MNLDNLSQQIGDVASTNMMYFIEKYSNGIFEHLSKEYSRDFKGNGIPVITDAVPEEIISKYNREWQPKDYDIQTRILKIFPCKTDFEIFPKEVRASHLETLNDLDSPELTFAQYLFIVVVNKVFRAMEKDLIFRGDSSITPETQQASADGFIKHIADDLNSGSPEIIRANQEITATTITIDNAVDTLEALFDLVPVDKLDRKFSLFVSPSVFKLYVRNYRFDFSSSLYNRNEIPLNIDGFDVNICKTIGLQGQSMLLAQKNHFKVFAPENENEIEFETQPFVRGLRMLFDFQFGTQFPDITQVYFHKLEDSFAGFPTV